MPASEQGADRKGFWVSPRVLIFIFDDHERVLLIRGAHDKKIWPNQYNGVGGHIEPREDVLCGALRELQEETGITGLPLGLVGILNVSVSESMGVQIFIFRGKYQSQEITASGEGALEWVCMNELNQYSLVEDLPILLPRVYRCKAGDPLFFAYSYYEDEALKLVFHPDQGL